jgi:hypothetical protein
VYTAPTTAGTYHVIATSQADTTKSATIPVTVTAVVVSVTAASATVYDTMTDQFTATVTGPTNTAVTWSIQENPAAGGTISATGLYTAPVVAVSTTYHVIATSQADTTKSKMLAVTVNPIVVSVTAASATVYDTMTDQFTATVTGPTNTAVTWSIQEGAAGGTISAAGLYTAPTTAGTYHVIATSQADTTKSATLAVTVNPILVNVTAASGTVYPNLTDQFTATVTGPTNTAVTWSIQEGAAGGTISATGLYTAPATAGTYHVIATSQADPTKSGTLAVTVTALTVSVSPASPTVFPGLTDQFSATVTGSTNQNVTWSITENPAAGGTISALGLYTAPAVTASTTYHVIATSVADSTVSGSFAITVNPSVVVTVTAPSGPFYETGTYQFSASVTGSTNQSVTWSVTGSGTGTISASGLYTAPAAAGTYTVTATSVADNLQSGSASVVVSIPTPLFTSTPGTTLGESTPTYTYDIVATDPATTTISYALTSGPGSISGSTLSWTPTDADRMMPSSFTVTATALGVTSTQSWIVTPLRAVTMTLVDNFWNVGPVSPQLQPLYSLSTLGVIVPGSTATPCLSGGISLTICSASLTTTTGSYTIDNVPAGYYWLAVGPTEKYYTNVNSFASGTDYVGQLLGAPSTAQPIDISALTLDATASPTVSPSDTIWIGSPNTTAWFAPQSALPTSGVSFTDTTESIAAGTLPAINSAEVDGESLEPSWILQFSTPGITGGGTLGYVGMSIVADESLGTSFTYASTVAGSLTPSTPETLRFTTNNWSSLIPAVTYTLSGGSSTPRLVYFATYLASLPYTTAPLAAIGGGYPSCETGSLLVPCSEAPGLVGWPAYSFNAPDPDLLSVAPQNNREAGNDAGPLFLAFAQMDSPTCTSTPTTLCTPPNGDTVSMAVDNAFASTGWPMVLSSQVEIQVSIGAPSNFSTISTTQLSVSSLSSAITDQPVVYPVTAPTLNGASLYTAASGIAPPLTLSWTAATVNSAISGAKLSGYHVIVYAVPTSGQWGSALANLYTPNASLTIPTGLLPAGTYVFVVESRADALANVTSAPWHSHYPRGTAQVVSAPITITGS